MKLLATACFFASSLLFLLPSSVLSVNPVGIVNGGNYCYMSSIVQTLFHIPSVRERIQRTSSTSIVHTMLATLFSRMSRAQPGDIIDMNIDFLHAVRGTNVNYIEGNPDDAGQFFLYLMEQHMPWAYVDYFKMIVQETKSYKGFVYLDNIEPRSFLSVPVVRLDGHTPIHEVMDLKDEILTNVIPEDVLEFLESDAAKKAFLECVNDDLEMLKDVSVRTSESVIFSPKILVFNVSKAEEGVNAQGVFTSVYNTSIPTPFAMEFTRDGVKYVLQSAVNYVPGHYYTITLTDAVTDTWYCLNDSRASKISSIEDLRIQLGGSPRLLFYVQEDELNDWITNPQANEPKPLEKYNELAYTLETLSHAVNQVQEIVGVEAIQRVKLDLPVANENEEI